MYCINIQEIFNLKNFIKVLLTAIYTVCIYGLVLYFLNCKLVNLFGNPDNFNGFLCVNLPIFYSTIFSRYKIFRNKYLNYFFKKSFIFIYLLTVIFIQTPIWLILSVIITVLYFKNRILKFAIKHFLAFSIFTILFLFLTFVLVNHVNFNGFIFKTLSKNPLYYLIIYYMFLIFLIKECKKILRQIPESLEKRFISGVRFSYIAIICCSIYNINFDFFYLWFLYGLIICFVFRNW